MANEIVRWRVGPESAFRTRILDASRTFIVDFVNGDEESVSEVIARAAEIHPEMFESDDTYDAVPLNWTRGDGARF